MTQIGHPAIFRTEVPLLGTPRGSTLTSSFFISSINQSDSSQPLSPFCHFGATTRCVKGYSVSPGRTTNTAGCNLGNKGFQGVLMTECPPPGRPFLSYTNVHDICQELGSGAHHAMPTCCLRKPVMSRPRHLGWEHADWKLTGRDDALLLGSGYHQCIGRGPWTVQGVLYTACYWEQRVTAANSVAWTVVPFQYREEGNSVSTLKGGLMPLPK